MKYRLLEILCEPTTGETFECEVFELEDNKSIDESNGCSCTSWCHLNACKSSGLSKVQKLECSKKEIISGKLVAKQSGIEYPIIGGIPRILSHDLLRDVYVRHNVFLETYGDHFSLEATESEYSDARVAKTADAFGFQWTKFVDNYDYFLEIFLSFTRPFKDRDDFLEKLVFEVGCGSGRPAVSACKLGAEVVAMDLGVGVESAFLQSRKFSRLHVVQGNAYAPPVRPVFDFVYSVGVLQHIADPLKALKGMRCAMNKDTDLILWVYGKRELWYQPIEAVRILSRKMPYRLLIAFSYVAAILSEVFLLIPYRLLSISDATRRWADYIPGKIYANLPFKENVLGWFDRLVAPVTYYFSGLDIKLLLENAGFSDIEMHARKEASASWVVRARKNVE